MREYSESRHLLRLLVVKVCQISIHTSIFLKALSHSFCPGPDVEQTFSSSLIESVTALQYGKEASNDSTV